jgi:MFS family permease
MSQTDLIAGNLIQMNAHQEITGEARAMIIFGVVVAVFCAGCAVAALCSRKKAHRWRYVVAFAALAAIGIGVAVAGSNQPRRRVIMACANGPVSLEMVAGVYNIAEVDGKMLKLIER